MMNYSIPKISKEEQLSIDYAKACGCKWIAKDKSGYIFAYRIKPIKGNAVWASADGEDCCLRMLIPISFINWEDEEPYYLGD